MRRVFFLLVAVVFLGALAESAPAAAPRYILVTGPDLPRPILLGDHSENLELFTSALEEGRAVERASLLGRPSFDLAFFSTAWEREAREGKLRPRDTDYHGRVWPAVGIAPAVIDLDLSERPGPHVAGPTALRIFKRHGVPLRFAECGRPIVRAVARAFVNAFNRGDLWRLDRVIAREPLFRQYSVGRPAPRLRAKASDRSTLLQYFKARHRRHESLRLVRFRFKGKDSVSGGRILGHFRGVFTRKADDVPRSRRSFNGAVECGAGPGVLVGLSIA